MKLIDIHTHFFPDEIAAGAIRALNMPGAFEACCDGTVAGLREFMRADGVSLSVNLPVATKKEQVAGINRRMIAFNRTSPGDVVCFGTMHPEFPLVGDIREEIAFLAENGVKGIKLHPDYQEFYPDDPQMAPVYEACRDAGLVILFHAGFDFPFPDLTRGTPERLREVTKVDGLKLVFAHLGGYLMGDAVLKHLAGTPAYFDTAFTFAMDEAAIREIVSRHGADRIVFGSDFPWARAGVIRDRIRRAVPAPAALEKIFHANAARLLGLAQAGGGAKGLTRGSVSSIMNTQEP